MSQEELDKYSERSDKIALYASLDDDPLAQEYGAKRDIVGLTERILAINLIKSREVTRFVNDRNCILNIGILARKNPIVAKEIRLFGSLEGYRNELIRIRDTDVLADAFHVAYLSEIGNRQKEDNIFSALIMKHANAISEYQSTRNLDLMLFDESERNSISSKDIDSCEKIVIDYASRMKKMNALAYAEDNMRHLDSIEKAYFPYDIVFQRPVYQYLGYMGMMHQNKVILLGMHVGKEARIQRPE